MLKFKIITIMKIIKTQIYLVINNLNNKLFIYLLLNPFIMYIIIMIFYTLIFIYMADVSLCDDNYKFNGRVSDYVGERSDNRGTWGGELDGRPIRYEPYRLGLQATSEGYRYELESIPREYSATNTGTGIRAPHTYESTATTSNRVGNSNNFEAIYSTDSESSYNIGEINPIDSEYYRDTYVHSNNVPYNIPQTKVGFFGKVTHKLKRAAKYVSDDLDKTRAKAAKDRAKTRELDRQLAMSHERYRKRTNEWQSQKLYNNLYGRESKNSYSSRIRNIY